ncbi:leucyl/phenylalanyl-tRNA--protein transferase [Edwardsiella tarda]|uniref:leucyl/phenylalanyl-tRNA--protein transferase n=1 Tax=Edwardsiella tarda TaxID=636 RepID=UPI00351C305B
MRIMQLDKHALAFPSPEQALREPNGLLAIGGDLQPERLWLAYQRGIFPWFSPGQLILWWSPDPRAVLSPAALHISHSLRKAARRTPLRVTLNHDFAGVIAGCAERRSDGTWIGPSVQQAYGQLHRLGHAHSVEVWQGDQLVGGLYGVALGTLFCGESMFSRVSNASKMALWSFCRHFQAMGGQLIDCQVLNSHTASLGAEEIPRRHYLQQLLACRGQSLDARCWRQQSLTLGDPPPIAPITP